VAAAASQLRIFLGGRAERLLLRAAPGDLADLRPDERISLAGLSSPESGIVSGDVVEAYVEIASVESLVEDYLLDRVAHENDANVVMHVVGHDIVREVPPLWREAAVLPILLAADLAEHRRPREQARAAELMGALRGDEARARRDGRG
jgi:hypothetical protein